MDEIINKFFQDRDWKVIEDMIKAHIDPLRDLLTVDTDKPAEHVKADVMARKQSYKAMYEFLKEKKIIKPTQDASINRFN